MKNLVKKLMLAAMTLSLGLVGVTASVQAQDSESPVLDKIKADGKIVLGTSADFPPFEWHLVEDGQDTIVGFDIDIAQAIADALEVELVVEDMNFDSLVAAVKTGRVDMVMAGMNPTEERKKEVDFSDIYYQSGFVALVPADKVGDYADFNDIANLKVGVQKGTSQEAFVNETLTEAEITSMPKNDALIAAMMTNRLDAIIIDKIVGEQFVSVNPDIAIANFEVPHEEDGTAIAIAKGNEALLVEIQAVLDELTESGEIEELFIKNIDLMAGSVE
ncbi:transporter substrate-binding domain-containing protein [Fundicoccus culcitae]|uniref:Transporter substrate-binding domain-containing protein n=1 Tax=Fundicoccus culcitae TaxID=2969821 RepID=A0ABY5P565_9LACT|nr:transporter substrate-binding domain-containing protein [Fundicoccus culcitae]UUX33894.1 transporter substrate-binding domain-containing protein [Fundicoccus culcitae]